MCIFKCSSDMLPLLVHLNNMELRNTGPTTYDFRVRYVTFVKTDNLLRPLLIRESAWDIWFKDALKNHANFYSKAKLVQAV